MLCIPGPSLEPGTRERVQEVPHHPGEQDSRLRLSPRPLSSCLMLWTLYTLRSWREQDVMLISHLQLAGWPSQVNYASQYHVGSPTRRHPKGKEKTRG